MKWSERINNFNVNSNEILLPFGVDNLFAAVAVAKALDLFVELLSFDKLLSSRIFLEIFNVMLGVELRLCSTFFSRNNFFTSIFSSLQWNLYHSSIANIYMEPIGRTAITGFHTPSFLSLRYVEDTLSILDKQHIKPLQHFN